MLRENRKCTSFCINYFHALAIVDLCKFPILKFYRFIAQLLYSKLTLIFLPILFIIFILVVRLNYL